jgi:YD repeat-containing protein
LAAGFNSSGSPVSATVSGAQITLTALAAGTIGDYPVTISNGDITVSAQTPTLTGGQNLVTGAGNFYSYQVGAYAPNGNILSHTDSAMGTWNFAYDTLNRLTTAQNTAVTGGSAQFANLNGCWTYDRGSPATGLRRWGGGPVRQPHAGGVFHGDLNALRQRRAYRGAVHRDAAEQRRQQSAIDAASSFLPPG